MDKVSREVSDGAVGSSAMRQCHPCSAPYFRQSPTGRLQRKSRQAHGIPWHRDAAACPCHRDALAHLPLQKCFFMSPSHVCFYTTPSWGCSCTAMPLAGHIPPGTCPSSLQVTWGPAWLYQGRGDADGAVTSPTGISAAPVSHSMPGPSNTPTFYGPCCLALPHTADPNPSLWAALPHPKTTQNTVCHSTSHFYSR